MRCFLSAYAGIPRRFLTKRTFQKIKAGKLDIALIRIKAQITGKPDQEMYMEISNPVVLIHPLQGGLNVLEESGVRFLLTDALEEHFRQKQGNCALVDIGLDRIIGIAQHGFPYIP